MKSLLSLLLLPFISCSEPPKPPYELPPNAVSLVTADSTKTWKLARRFNDKTRMNMGDCFLSYRQTFRADSTMNDNAGENKNCGETLLAVWYLVKDDKGNSYIKLSSDQIPDLLQIEENYKFFKVIDLAEDRLTLQFRHRQFSGKARTITDFYVPEGTFVEDRDFHW